MKCIVWVWLLLPSGSHLLQIWRKQRRLRHQDPALLHRDSLLSHKKAEHDEVPRRESCIPFLTAETDPTRRKLLTYGGASVVSCFPGTAQAARKDSSLIMMNPKKMKDDQESALDGTKTGTVDTFPTVLSSERCILQLLPVKNPVFRTLEKYVDSLSTLRTETVDDAAILAAQKTLKQAIEFLDKKRSSLEPVFNEDDSALLQIEKAEQGERVIEQFRTELVVLQAYSIVKKTDELLARQKSALLALADIGELLVGQYPYDIPSEGKFSLLPRLTGRCKVTFTFKRGKTILGNVTILADGFAAPITAGNFVDLSARGFYTGLPVKVVKKKFGGSSSALSGFLPLESLGLEPDREESDPLSPSTVISVPILGSYREGFYDPLTAKPRRIPLEILREDTSGLSRLSYEQGFSEVTDASIDANKSSKPILSFGIKGLVALNHGERTLGSSEFFVLPDSMTPEKRQLVNNQYAPFGYIVDGYDIYQSLEAGDIIEDTILSSFGQENLVKLRGAIFSDVMQGDEEDGA